MLFTSGLFLYGFLPLFLALYYATPRGSRSLTLLLASCVFYGWWRPDFVVLMLASTFLDYGCGKAIGRARERAGGSQAGKPWVLLSICVNLGLLAYFKYANFGVETANEILVYFGYGTVTWTQVVLPIGISFYTFQSLSYTVDVFRGQTPPAERLRDLFCYVTMFPQLVAGPIVRYHTVADQLRARVHTWNQFGCGVLAFQAGLAKKVLLADTFGSLADPAFAADQLCTADAWLGTLAFTLQIYFDFSGYSDMAIGLGLMVGFRLPVNFDRPYRSVSITEFWRRWHISLSSFLRDYLYRPLGGNRRGRWRTVVNLSFVMVLGGLWHGAHWTFLAWGAFHGFWLVVERLTGGRSLVRFLPRLGQVALTLMVVMFGWVLFRAESVAMATSHWGTMLGVPSCTAAEAVLNIRPAQILAGAAALMIVGLAPTTQELLRRTPVAWGLVLQPLFLWSLVHLHHRSHVPFLYFQF